MGLQRTGKTHHLDWMLEQVQSQPNAPHAIVVDAVGEWPIRPLRREAVVCTYMESAVAESRNKPFVIWKPSVPPTQSDVCELADAVRGRGRLLVVPELHMFLPPGQMAHVPEPLRRIVLMSRHHNVGTALWGDTQYLRNVHPNVISSGILHIFGQTAPADLERLRQLISAEAVDAVKEAARRAADPEYGGDGEKGWHITVDPLNRVAGAFRLRRTNG